MTFNEYQLKYELFLAEQELNNNMILFGSDLISESAGLFYINEGVKETILKYVNRVSGAIQHSWETFKGIVTRTIDEGYLKLVKEKIEETKDPGFTIINYKDYDISKLDSINLIPFNYEEMKMYLNSKELFMTKYYTDLNARSVGSTLREQMNNMVIKSIKDTRCTKEILQSMYNFVTSDYKAYMDKIEADLKTVNTSNKNIEAMVKTVISAENEAAIIFESYLYEAEDSNNDKKAKFKDDENRQDNNSNLTKHVTTYMKASTDILTAKMKIVKDMYAQDMETIRHFVKPSAKDSKEDNKDNESNTTSGIRTIEI